MRLRTHPVLAYYGRSLFSNRKVTVLQSNRKVTVLGRERAIWLFQ